MIKDIESKSKIGQDWVVVRKLEKMLASKKFLAGGRIMLQRVPDASQNLPFVLAYSVLDKVFKQLRKEGVIKCKGCGLETMMKVSRSTLSWQNYDLVDKGRNARNDLAHKAILSEKDDCCKYINAIEVELKAWEVI